MSKQQTVHLLLFFLNEVVMNLFLFQNIFMYILSWFYVILFLFLFLLCYRLHGRRLATISLVLVIQDACSRSSEGVQLSWSDLTGMEKLSSLGAILHLNVLVMVKMYLLLINLQSSCIKRGKVTLTVSRLRSYKLRQRKSASRIGPIFFLLLLHLPLGPIKIH